MHAILLYILNLLPVLYLQLMQIFFSDDYKHTGRKIS